MKTYNKHEYFLKNYGLGELQFKNKDYKYIPNIEFQGMTECFSKINQETLDFEIN